MTLTDLIDLEAQLARDRAADPGALGARDRALLAGAPPERRRDVTLARWLAALREHEPGRAWPGRRVEGALAAVRALLSATGLVLGWGAATALLRAGDSQPVNVWDFLLALVGGQVVLLALLLGSFFVPLAAFGTPILGLVRGAVAALVERLARRASGERPASWRALWHRLRSRRSLYQHVEPWLLLATTQAFGVAFNVGAIAAVLRLVVFSDLSFAWSTTLVDLDAPAFHALARAVAAPWAAIWPAAVPSLDLVARTRYSHLEAAYLWSGAGRAARPESVGGWWPFLVAALACYGLLPRLALLLLSSWRTRRALRRLALDDAEVSRVLGRLSEPHVETRAASAEAPGAEPRAAPAPQGAAPPAGGRGALLLWRDAPAPPVVTAALARQARCQLGGPVSVDGEPDPGPLVEGADAVVVLAESWEAPDRATMRFLRGLREAAGAGRPLLLVLVDTATGAARAPAPEAVGIWRDALAPLADPWLAIEPLAGAT
jgi:hypothetical protein